jgi:uncharacterized protein (DUF2461 family)
MAAVIRRGGRKDTSNPATFFQLGAQGIDIGGGLYKPDNRSLLKVRQAIVRDGAALARALKGKAFKDIFGELRGEKNKRLPKEFAEKMERFPFIANKHLYYFTNYDDPQLLLRPDLDKFFMKHYRAGLKVNEFLKAAVG